LGRRNREHPEKVGQEIGTKTRNEMSRSGCRRISSGLRLVPPKWIGERRFWSLAGDTLKDQKKGRKEEGKQEGRKSVFF